MDSRGKAQHSIAALLQIIARVLAKFHFRSNQSWPAELLTRCYCRLSAVARFVLGFVLVSRWEAAPIAGVVLAICDLPEPQQIGNLNQVMPLQTAVKIIQLVKGEPAETAINSQNP